MGADEIREKIGQRKVVLSVSGGKDSAAASLYLRELGIEHERVFADTGWEHPLTYEHIRGELTRVLGPIVEVRAPWTLPELDSASGHHFISYRPLCPDHVMIPATTLAWTNLRGTLRTFRHVWRGLARASETGVPHLHPTQKPIALSLYVFRRAKLERGALVFVPYLGSGPDLPAARAAGLRVIACDIEEWCCRVAVSRLRAAPAPEPPEQLGPLFGRGGP